MAIVWIEKRRGGIGSGAHSDVALSIIKTGYEGRLDLVIRLSTGVMRKAGIKANGWVRVGVDADERTLVVEAADDGYKLQRSSSLSGLYRVSIRAKRVGLVETERTMTAVGHEIKNGSKTITVFLPDGWLI